MRTTLPLLSILAVVAVVFSFGITDGHISMDDWGYIYGCPFVRGGLTLDNLVRAYTEIGCFLDAAYICDIHVRYIAFWRRMASPSCRECSHPPGECSARRILVANDYRRVM